jgi:hypothetical protein
MGGMGGIYGNFYYIYKKRNFIMYSNDFQVKPTDPINISNIITYWKQDRHNLHFINYWKTDTLSDREFLFNKIIDEYHITSIDNTLHYLNTYYQDKTIIVPVLDIINGIWSNIPTCCNYSFSVNNIHGADFRKNNSRLLNTHYYKTRYNVFNYIPCSHCFESNRKIHTILSNGLYKYDFYEMRWLYIK